MRRREIEAFVNRIAREVDDLPAPRLKALAPALTSAWAELEAELAQLIGEGKEHRFTAQNYRRALIQLRPAMEHLDTLRPALFDQLMIGHSAAEDMAHRHLLDTFQFFMNEGKDGYSFEKSLFPIPIRQAARVAEKGLIDKFKSSAERYPENVRRDIRLQLAKGMLKGETPFQMSRRIAPKIAPHVPAGKAVGEALAKKYNFWAERIVRTELSHSYNTQAEAEAKDLAKAEPGEWLSEWNGILDGRICLDCRETDGQRVPIGGTFQPVNVTRPPAHSLCRCSLITVRRDWV